MRIERVAMWGGWLAGLAAAVAATSRGSYVDWGVVVWLASASTTGAMLAWLTARLARVAITGGALDFGEH